jgi:hypothetical protein
MIARIGYFERMTDEQRRIEDENYRGRFLVYEFVEAHGLSA